MALKQFDINGFCDLNVTSKPDDRFIARIIEFGYRAIALNWTVDARKMESKSASKKKKIAGKSNEKNEVIIFPPELSESFKKIISMHANKLKVFLRITIICGCQEELKSVLSHRDIKKYDIIAVLPATSTAYQLACCNHSVDLITFTIGVSDYKPNGKLHKQLVDRSGYYEISYSQALQSSAKRQETFSMAQYYSIYGKSRNVIISSGASHYLELRNPYDVANLGILFGLSSERGKLAVSSNCRLLLLAAAGRRYGRTAIVVEKIEDAEEEEPVQKRAKFSKNNISKVVDRISSLSTTESK